MKASAQSLLLATLVGTVVGGLLFQYDIGPKTASAPVPVRLDRDGICDRRLAACLVARVLPAQGELTTRSRFSCRPWRVVLIRSGVLRDPERRFLPRPSHSFQDSPGPLRR